MVFHWSLSNWKSLQVCRTLPRIPSDLSNAVVWMVSTRSLFSKTYSPCTNPLVTGPTTPITIGITVTFMFLRFFSSLARCRYLSLFSLSFSFHLSFRFLLLLLLLLEFFTSVLADGFSQGFE